METVRFVHGDGFPSTVRIMIEFCLAPVSEYYINSKDKASAVRLSPTSSQGRFFSEQDDVYWSN